MGKKEDPLSYLKVSNIVCREPDEFVYRAGDKADQIYLVMSGAVKIVSPLKQGGQLVTGIYQADSMFGESAILYEQRPDTAIAIDSVQLMTWATDQIEAAIRENRGLLTALLQLTIQRLEYSEERLKSFAADDARTRLAKSLIYLAQNTGEQESAHVSIPPLTHDVLASFIGVSRELVTHLMGVFRKQGLINYSRQAIDVHPEHLRTSIALVEQSRNPDVYPGGSSR